MAFITVIHSFPVDFSSDLPGLVLFSLFKIAQVSETALEPCRL